MLVTWHLSGQHLSSDGNGSLFCSSLDDPLCPHVQCKYNVFALMPVSGIIYVLRLSSTSPPCLLTSGSLCSSSPCPCCSWTRPSSLLPGTTLMVRKATLTLSSRTGEKVLPSWWSQLPTVTSGTCQKNPYSKNIMQSIVRLLSYIKYSLKTNTKIHNNYL